MILVVGAGGFLGKRFVNALRISEKKCITASHRPGEDLVIDLSQKIIDLDVAKEITHALILSSLTSIDNCHMDPTGTFAVNVANTINLIDNLVERGILPIFFSTDLVFKGERGNYQESDLTAPTTEFGRQKKAVEDHLLRNIGESLIVRLGKVFSLADDDTSPIRGLVRSLNSGEAVRAATDQKLTLSLAEEIVLGVLRLIDLQQTGIFHLVPAPNRALSRYELAVEDAYAIGAPLQLICACSIHEFEFAEPRPLDCTMNGNKFKSITSMAFTPFQSMAPQLGNFS